MSARRTQADRQPATLTAHQPSWQLSGRFWLTVVCFGVMALALLALAAWTHHARLRMIVPLTFLAGAVVWLLVIWIIDVGPKVRALRILNATRPVRVRIERAVASRRNWLLLPFQVAASLAQPGSDVHRHVRYVRVDVRHGTRGGGTATQSRTLRYLGDEEGLEIGERALAWFDPATPGVFVLDSQVAGLDLVRR